MDFVDNIFYYYLLVSLILYKMSKVFNSCYYKGIEYRNNI